MCLCQVETVLIRLAIAGCCQRPFPEASGMGRGGDTVDEGFTANGRSELSLGRKAQVGGVKCSGAPTVRVMGMGRGG